MTTYEYSDEDLQFVEHGDLTRQPLQEQPRFTPTPLPLLYRTPPREDRSDTPWVRAALLWIGAIAAALLLLFVILIGEPSLKRLDAGNTRTISVEGRR